MELLAALAVLGVAYLVWRDLKGNDTDPSNQ